MSCLLFEAEDEVLNIGKKTKRRRKHDKSCGMLLNTQFINKYVSTNVCHKMMCHIYWPLIHVCTDGSIINLSWIAICALPECNVNAFWTHQNAFGLRSDCNPFVQLQHSLNEISLDWNPNCHCETIHRVQWAYVYDHGDRVKVILGSQRSNMGIFVSPLYLCSPK